VDPDTLNMDPDSSSPARKGFGDQNLKYYFFQFFLILKAKYFLVGLYEGLSN
jgi:hypothetical protein